MIMNLIIVTLGTNSRICEDFSDFGGNSGESVRIFGIFGIFEVIPPTCDNRLFASDGSFTEFDLPDCRML